MQRNFALGVAVVTLFERHPHQTDFVVFALSARAEIRHVFHAPVVLRFPAYPSGKPLDLKVDDLVPFRG